MIKKFNPAPTDKHAADPKEVAKVDNASRDQLQKGLKEQLPGFEPSECNSTGSLKTLPQ